MQGSEAPPGSEAGTPMDAAEAVAEAEQPAAPAPAPPTSGHQYSLRRASIRTPQPQPAAAASPSPMSGQRRPATPAPVLIAQDTSPKLQDGTDGLPGSSRSYNLRPSTVKKARHSLTPAPRPAATPAAAGSAGGLSSGAPGSRGGAMPEAGGGMQLSPTEQAIRSSLRRSACKSSTAGPR